MQRVLGVGGIFLKARDPAKLARWYADNLGLPLESGWNGATLLWQNDPSPGACTVWALFSDESGYFGERSQRAMVNFRVRDLDAMLLQLRFHGVVVDDQIEDSEHGRFGWFTDPEGNRVELWQPPENG